jgi:hypothetical protein
MSSTFRPLEARAYSRHREGGIGGNDRCKGDPHDAAGRGSAEYGFCPGRRWAQVRCVARAHAGPERGGKADCRVPPREREARVLCLPEILQGALDSLVERRLVAALNTLIPSYVVRSEDLQFSGG